MDAGLLRRAEAAKGFMPAAEGLALHAAALSVPALGALVEIGTYCGKSTLYLGAAAREIGAVLFTVDHHRGSEEHQVGEEYHDPDLLSSDNRIDSLPAFRKVIAEAGLEDAVVAIVGRSATVARFWTAPIAFLFLDGGHSREAAFADYDGWARHIMPGGLLAIHDVFLDPSQGGQAPREVYRTALKSGDYVEARAEGSLRILRRTRQTEKAL